MVRKYEIALVIDTERDEAGVKEIVQKVTSIVKANGGEVDREDHWGRRQLAYPINKKEWGTYVVLIASGENSLVSELNRQLRIMDDVLRFLVVHKDKYAPDFIPRAREEGRPDRRGGERGPRDRDFRGRDGGTSSGDDSDDDQDEMSAHAS
ncbi:MAG: 30S ribosomal protein S6 [Bdellovibrionales bacterium]|nr:30S ribosomal protein S6 [Bdellovibrionales bacterium]